jgi:hypothetical protein
MTTDHLLEHALKVGDNLSSVAIRNALTVMRLRRAMTSALVLIEKGKVDTAARVLQLALDNKENERA